MCAYEFTHVCGYTCIYERRLYMWVHTFSNVYMSVYTYLHICVPSSHVSVYIFTCMVAEFTRVRVYVYIFAHRVCKWYMCLHICKLRLHVFVYISTHIHTESTCLRVYIYIFILCTYSVCAYKYRHTCLCLYLVYGCVLNVCVGIYICIGIHERPHGRIQIHCMRIGIHGYVSGSVHVCSCIHIYIREDTVCAYEFTHVCGYACIYERRLYMWVHTFLNVYMSVNTCLHICAPSSHVSVYIFTCMVAELLVFVYMFTYMHTEFASGICVYIYANRVYMCLCIYQHIYTRKLHV